MIKPTVAWAPLPLRIVLGAGMVYHGFPKLFSPEGHQAFAAMLTQIGVPAPNTMSYLVGVVEFFGGMMLVAGAFVGAVSVFLIVDMLVAAFTVHLPNGFSFLNITGMSQGGPTFGMPGYEVNLLYIAGLVSLILSGDGALSFDSRGGKSTATAEEDLAAA
ncbi:MAG: DoxX family protein [Anaerolineae bacterium]|nr:DoxX family protein [Gemmatimonadaceae bacterium]